MTKPLYVYDNDQALADGIFADVTPKSVKEAGKWRWIVTATLHEEFSIAAIAEMYNEMIMYIKKVGGLEKAEFPFSTKMNSKEVWCFVEQEQDSRTLVFKAIFPEEY